MNQYISAGNQWIFAFLFNIILIVFARGSSILTKSGWFHAGILGTILWGCLGFKGWISVVFYLICGSLVTKLGLKYKQNLGIAESRNGSRGPENVWGSASTGAFLAILSQIFTDNSNLILLGFCASFAAKLGDTFGSEIGKRFGKRTFLITNFRKVAPGTEGAISLEGTIASLFGCFLMTTFFFLISFIDKVSISLIILFSGFIATILESYLGAIFQARYKFLTNEFVNVLQTSLASTIAILFGYCLVNI